MKPQDEGAPIGATDPSWVAREFLMKNVQFDADNAEYEASVIKMFDECDHVPEPRTIYESLSKIVMFLAQAENTEQKQKRLEDLGRQLSLKTAQPSPEAN